jgi:hypothetical protein
MDHRSWPGEGDSGAGDAAELHPRGIGSRLHVGREDNDDAGWVFAAQGDVQCSWCHARFRVFHGRDTGNTAPRQRLPFLPLGLSRQAAVRAALLECAPAEAALFSSANRVYASKCTSQDALLASSLAFSAWFNATAAARRYFSASVFMGGLYHVLCDG